MIQCGYCGDTLLRVRRSIFEILQYSAAYLCRGCQRKHHAVRPYRLHFGPHARCPRCGSFRIARLPEKDGIDPMYRAVWVVLERLARGSRLFHCPACRVQFYDRRRLAPDAPPAW